MKKILLNTFCAIAFFGCGDESINVVKKTIIKTIDKNLTIGEAIDGFKDCESVKWQSAKITNNSYKVLATCKIKSSVLKDQQAQESMRQILIDDECYNRMCGFRFLKSQLIYDSKTDVKELSEEALVKLASKYCTIKKLDENYDDWVCDEKVNEELKNFNFEPEKKDKNIDLKAELESILVNVGTLGANLLKPNVNSRAYELLFVAYVDSDSQAFFKGSRIINDGEDIRINTDRLLQEFYKR